MLELYFKLFLPRTSWKLADSVLQNQITTRLCESGSKVHKYILTRVDFNHTRGLLSDIVDSTAFLCQYCGASPLHNQLFTTVR